MQSFMKMTKNTPHHSLLPFLLLLQLSIFSVGPASSADTINLGGDGVTCSGCSEPGYFCGNDGQCHEMSCQNYYNYADVKLTGHADNTPFQCFGYTLGDEENAHGVVYGCEPIFPFTLFTPGKQVSEPFNQKCTAEREGGFSFECYEFQPSETATDFTLFEREAESSFPDCEGGKSPKYYYIIASSNRYVGFEGLLGNPIVASGSDSDGNTIWSTNEGETFKREIAMHSMYANVVGGPGPAAPTNTIQVNPIEGQNPLTNHEDHHGGPPITDGAATIIAANTAVLGGFLLGVGMLVQWF